MTRVLIVDDEPGLLKALAINLRARDYEVTTARDGTSALTTAARQPPDVIVLDLGLPDMDGTDVISGLRGWSTAPIIVLSARAGQDDKVIALDAGADDYVTKPFSVEELLARIRAVTRRTTEPEPVEPVQIGRWIVDLSDHSIYETIEDHVGGNDAPPGSTKYLAATARQLHLTPTEWQLLEALVRHPGRLVSQRQLLQEVWGPTYVEQAHYLRQYVKALRHKLEDDPSRPRHLITEAGMGYRFQP